MNNAMVSLDFLENVLENMQHTLEKIKYLKQKRETLLKKINVGDVKDNTNPELEEINDKIHQLYEQLPKVTNREPNSVYRKRYLNNSDYIKIVTIKSKLNPNTFARLTKEDCTLVGDILGALGCTKTQINTIYSQIFIHNTRISKTMSNQEKRNAIIKAKLRIEVLNTGFEDLEKRMQELQYLSSRHQEIKDTVDGLYEALTLENRSEVTSYIPKYVDLKIGFVGGYSIFDFEYYGLCLLNKIQEEMTFYQEVTGSRKEFQMKDKLDSVTEFKEKLQIYLLLRDAMDNELKKYYADLNLQELEIDQEYQDIGKRKYYYLKKETGESFFEHDLKSISAEYAEEISKILTRFCSDSPLAVLKPLYNNPNFTGMYEVKSNVKKQQVRICYTIQEGICCILGIMIKKKDNDLLQYNGIAGRRNFIPSKLPDSLDIEADLTRSILENLKKDKEITHTNL